MAFHPETARSLRWPAQDVLIGVAYTVVVWCLLFAWPALPTQDTPLWVYEARLLSDAVRGVAADGCRLVSALPPNALAQGVLALLLPLFGAELAARLYLAACVGGFVAALLYLGRARDPSGRSVAPLLVLPLCAGYPLFHGFLNYLAALPVLTFGIALLLRNPDGRGVRARLALFALPTLTYLCHGVALGVWVLLVAVQLWVRRNRSFAWRSALGFVPVLALAVLYVAQRSGEGASITWSAGGLGATVLYRLRSPLRFFSVFQGLTPTFDDPALAWLAPLCVSLNLLYALVLLGASALWAVRARRSADAGERVLSRCVLLLLALFVALPHDVAKMLNPAERLLIPLACCGAAGLAARDLRRWRFAIYGLLVLQCAYAAGFGTRAAYAARSVARARAQHRAYAVQAQDLAGVTVPKPRGWIALLTRHQVLAMQGLLEATAQGQVVVPFGTGFFRCDRQEGAPHDLHGLQQSEQTFILLGERAQLDALSARLAPSQRVIERGAGFAVLQPRAARMTQRYGTR